jgi:hypothetical protein
VRFAATRAAVARGRSQMPAIIETSEYARGVKRRSRNGVALSSL